MEKDAAIKTEVELFQLVRLTPEYKDFQQNSLPAKIDREGRAWSLIEQYRGRYDKEKLNQIFDTVDLDPRNTRWFGSLLAQPNRNLIFKNPIASINDWFEQLLFVEHPVDEALDRCLGQMKLKGISTGLATLLLYLRDPDTCSIWLPATQQGLAALGRMDDKAKGRNGAGYKVFNDHVLRFRQDFQISPREVDWYLTFLGKRVQKILDGYVLIGTSSPPKPLTGFETLFQQFVADFLQKPVGQNHMATYEPSREQGRANFRAIAARAAEGQWDEQLTDMVLRTLLPHNDSDANRQRKAWIHIAPAFSGDIRVKFENIGWAKPQDWPDIARALFHFFQQCGQGPAEYESALATLETSGKARGFQTGALTPMLNALRPDDYSIVNSKPLRVVNYFCKSNFRQTLSDYPAINRALKELRHEKRAFIEKALPAGSRPHDLFDAFSHWLVAVCKFDFRNNRNNRYWKIAPGAGAWNWEAWRDEGIATIGWEELGDLSQASRADFEAIRDQALRNHPEWTTVALEQVWKFAKEIREGDRIVANRGTSTVLGIGTVIGEYQFKPGVRHGHRLPVEWSDIEAFEVQEKGWKRTLIELNRGKFETIEARCRPGNPDPQAAFTPEAFSILKELHETPTAAYYQSHKEIFRRTLEEPFRALLRDVADRFPAHMKTFLETEKQVFGRITKNDYGKGGAWDFYWGAFYPKGGKRTQGAQLIASLHPDRLQFGFYMGEYGSDHRRFFLKNVKNLGPEIRNILSMRLADEKFVYGTGESGEGSEELTFEKWLGDPAGAGIAILKLFSASELLRWSREELVDNISKIFQTLYPLFLLASLEDPLQEIMNIIKPAEKNPEYPLSACALDTGFDEPILARWIRAIERKGQAVLYGPPGTGKTYLAEKLARHLIGGGDGFAELVQFHPTYAYEDFIQGIRPRTRPDGAIEYPIVAGRFLEFCRNALSRKDRCVLIVDEINRTNLSRVFGELMYLLEYRDRQIPLAGGELFLIPQNVRMIGTMNTADRSIALVDHALRRRFAFLELCPKYEILEHYHRDKNIPVAGLIDVLKRINQQIGDKHYSVGISFFLCSDLIEQIEDIWCMEIEPYLEEFFFDQPAKADEFRWEKVKEKVLGS